MTPPAAMIGSLLATPGLVGREVRHTAEIIRAIARCWNDGPLAQSWLGAADLLERIAPAFDGETPFPSVAELRRRRGAALASCVTPAAQPAFAVLRNMPAPHVRARTLEEARLLAAGLSDHHPGVLLTVIQVLETHHLGTRWPDPDSENLT